MRALALFVLGLGVLLPAATPGQQAGPPGSQRPHPDLSRPAPRGPDGRISFTGTPSEVGNWEGPAGATMIFNKGRPFQQASLPTNLTVDQVPFQPWAREQYLKRQANLTSFAIPRPPRIPRK